jgi:hypothetical protein
VRAYNESLTITVHTNARCVPRPPAQRRPCPKPNHGPHRHSHASELQNESQTPHATWTRNLRPPAHQSRRIRGPRKPYSASSLEVAATAIHKNGRRTRQREQGSYRASAAAEEARGDAGRHWPESRRRLRAEGERGTSTTDLIRSGLSLSLPWGRGEEPAQYCMSIMRSENENGGTRKPSGHFFAPVRCIFVSLGTFCLLPGHVDSYSHIFGFSI